MSLPQSFESLSLDDLHEFVARGQEESLHLDFKTIADSSLSTADDRRSFARALSGFANSSGGLVVWGIDARKNSDGVDCAVGFKEIDRVPKLVARLNQLTGEAAEPTVPGVLHRAIVSADRRGFAVTLVPESDRGPHMAKLGLDHYYKRSGDSFYRMEHFDIADMFTRRRRPRLVVTATVRGFNEQAAVQIGLRNEGRASAKSAYLAIQCPPPFSRSRWGLDGNGLEGMQNTRSMVGTYSWAYEGGSGWVLHPGVSREILLLHLGLQPKAPPSSDLVVEYAIACDDHPLEESSVVIPLAKLITGG